MNALSPRSAGGTLTFTDRWHGSLEILPGGLAPKERKRIEEKMQTVADREASARAAGAPTAPARRSSLSPFYNSELARLAGLVGLYSFLAVLFLRAFYITDPDIWWHLRTGDWILAHHSVPFTDPFSSYGMGKPWAAYSWLFEVLSASVFARLGLMSIVLLEITVRVALSVALFHLVQGLCGAFWRSVALTAAGLWVMTSVIGPRPGMLTILFVIVEFDILLSVSRTGRAKLLWLLPPMFALWANWHIQFVYGLFVLGVFACEPLLASLTGYVPREKSLLPVRQAWLVFAVSALATLLNPYGWKIYSTVFIYMGQTGAYNTISELRAMTFREPQHFGVLLLGLGAAMAIGWRRDARPLWVIFLVVTSLLAFRSVREVWFLAIVAVAVIAGGWNRGQGADLGDSMPLRLRLGVAVCVLAVLAVSVRHYSVSNDWLSIQVAGNFPEGASRFVEQHHLGGPLLNDLSWGGFLMWRLPQLPVAIDGRTNVHGDARILEFANLWTGKPGWASDPELVKANLVITPRVSAIASLLRTDSRFEVAYEDVQAVVFRRRS